MRGMFYVQMRWEKGYGVGCFVPDGSQFAQDYPKHRDGLPDPKEVDPHLEPSNGEWIGSYVDLRDVFPPITWNVPVFVTFQGGSEGFDIRLFERTLAEHTRPDGLVVFHWSVM